MALTTTPGEAQGMDVPYLETDVIVAGGGPSGVAAAVAAARTGARTVLVERYGRLGGAGVTSMVNPLMGYAENPLVHEVQRRFAEDYENNWELLDLVYADLAEAAGVRVILHAWVFDTLVEDRCVKGIRILTKEGVLTLRAKVVVDATADGDVAFKAGAPFEQGRTHDGRLQPMTIMFRLGGVDKERALLCGSEEEALEVRVPDGTWHDVVVAGMGRGELPKNVGIIRVYESDTPHERLINATQVNHVDGTRVADLTRAELDGRRQATPIVRFLRAHAPGYENAFISNMPAVIGVRETRRFLGLRYLTGADLVAGRRWPDAVVRNVCFVIDIHNPDGAGQAEGFAQQAQPYDIPYGCLVPRDIDGLVLSGRCISGSHEAHASYRVQKIVMAIGVASGVAAALSARQDVAPRDLDVADVQRTLTEVAGGY